MFGIPDSIWRASATPTRPLPGQAWRSAQLSTAVVARGFLLPAPGGQRAHWVEQAERAALLHHGRESGGNGPRSQVAVLQEKSYTQPPKARAEPLSGAVARQWSAAAALLTRLAKLRRRGMGAADDRRLLAEEGSDLRGQVHLFTRVRWAARDRGVARGSEWRLRFHAVLEGSVDVRAVPEERLGALGAGAHAAAGRARHRAL
eukprot:2079692-Pyramimonas_sp.AAC.1